MSKRVSPIEDLPVSVHPGVSNPDLVPLKQVLVREAVRQVVALEVGHTRARNDLHGAPTWPHLQQKRSIFYFGVKQYRNVYACNMCFHNILLVKTFPDDNSTWDFPFAKGIISQHNIPEALKPIESSGKCFTWLIKTSKARLLSFCLQPDKETDKVFIYPDWQFDFFCPP